MSDFLVPGPDDPLLLTAVEPDGTRIATGFGARSFLTTPAHGLDQLERLAQRAGEERLNACNEALWAEEEGSEVDPSGEGSEWRERGSDSPAMAPYCGCDTCIVREVLDAAWPHLLEAARLAVNDERVANDERPPHHARAVDPGGG